MGGLFSRLLDRIVDDDRLYRAVLIAGACIPQLIAGVLAGLLLGRSS